MLVLSGTRLVLEIKIGLQSGVIVDGFVYDLLHHLVISMRCFLSHVEGARW